MSKKKAKKKQEPKRKRIKCPECGREYDEGAPHAMFCRGLNPLPPCDVCGEESRDNFKCEACGSVSCTRCGDPMAKLCEGCMETV